MNNPDVKYAPYSCIENIAKILETSLQKSAYCKPVLDFIAGTFEDWYHFIAVFFYAMLGDVVLLKFLLIDCI
jgi:hypothetical protein